VSKSAPKSSYFTAIGSFSTKHVADNHIHALATSFLGNPTSMTSNDLKHKIGFFSFFRILAAVHTFQEYIAPKTAWQPA